VRRVVIVGGGIAGLSIAQALRREVPGVELLVLEARGSAGGNIRSIYDQGYLCEAGPDGFLDNAPATVALVEELGLSHRLRPSNPAARHRFIFLNGTLQQVPVTFKGFLRTRLLSWRGKLRIAAEPFAPPCPAGDETIHEFAARRIGPEAADILIGSMVSGVFAGDARELSLRACFPKMWEMESEYGGLFRAMLARRKQALRRDSLASPAGTLTSFEGGMEDLVRALVASLDGSVRTNNPVVALRQRRGDGPRPFGARAFGVLSGNHMIEADAVVLSGPAGESAALVRPFDSGLATLLDTISTAPLVVACLGYDEAALTADRGALNGFGFLVPRGKGIRILGALWESSIYSSRAPAGRVLIRVMVGGATDRSAVDLPDSELLSIVRSDLERTMGVRSNPTFVRLARHRRGIPQYTIGHTERLARIEARLQGHSGLFLAGSSYRGVSVNACIADAPRVAALVAGHLRSMTVENECAVGAR
jgi:protoporphyrinogen/coproporphyrinogen III oxidase